MWTKPDTEPETWRVVTARRYREAVARVRLAEQGLETYLPLLRRWPRPPVGSDVGPLFPGYVFVRAERTHFHRITRTPGVGDLIVFGGEPARLDDAVIDFLRGREEPDGIITAGPLPSGSSRLRRKSITPSSRRAGSPPKTTRSTTPGVRMIWWKRARAARTKT